MSVETAFTHPLLSVETFPVQGPDRVHRYVRIRTSDWVNCVPITTDGQVVLVRQHRWGIDQVTLEVPGGAVDPGEDAAEAGIREVLEETGYGDAEVVPLGWVWANPAIQTNRTSFFLLRGVRRVAEPDPDPNEDIEVVTVPMEQVVRLVRDGTIRHSLAVAALQRAVILGHLPSP